ncbi:hypothetical protein HYW74_05070 [Candidatus Pacearchaeota archaeon]|nr:hypothetical protein [Candidatus Pacearchaeota archaeon]
MAFVESGDNIAELKRSSEIMLLIILRLPASSTHGSLITQLLKYFEYTKINIDN